MANPETSETQYNSGGAVCAGEEAGVTKPVPWYTVAPLKNERALSSDIVLPFELAAGVSLSAPPAEYHDPAIASWIEKCHGSERGFQKARVAFVAKYEADSMGDPDPDWKGPSPRSKQDRALDAIRFANIAAWLARPSALGFEFFLHLNVEKIGGVTIWHSGTFFALRTHPDYDGAIVSRADLTKTRELAEALATVPRPGVLATAARMMWFALTEDQWDTKFLLLWVALEALFGPEDYYAKRASAEIPRRVARLFGRDRKEEVEAYRIVEDSYDWRSRVAHGQRVTGMTEAKSKDLVRFAEGMVRTAFRRVLKEPSLIETFSDSNRREAHLDALAKDFPLPTEAECVKWPVRLEEPHGPKEPKRAGKGKK